MKPTFIYLAIVATGNPPQRWWRYFIRPPLQADLLNAADTPALAEIVIAAGEPAVGIRTVPCGGLELVEIPAIDN